jgi:hypothetical protein
VNNLNIDASLARVIDTAREKYAPVARAMAARESVDARDFGAVTGALGALLGALDARIPEQQAKAVA